MANDRNNPKNQANELFRKLTRLLSGPVVNYRRQLPRKQRRRQLDKYKFKSASGQSFKKEERSPYGSMHANYMAQQNRQDRYIDFDQMEYTPEIASAMDIYADEMTTSTDLQPLLKIRCPNEEIKYILQSLYTQVLNIEFNLFGWCRTMCKYGDFFLYLDVDEKDGIRNVIGLPTSELERLEGEDKTNPNYVQFQWNSGAMTFENWQVAHFRVLGNDKFAPYGTSVLEPARRIWRQLTLIEDAMMAYRIVRSPERRVFYIDVGNIAPADIEQYMQKVITQMKRNQIVDQDTGRVDLRYNPMSVEEDYYIPVRAGQSSKIETLPGGTYTGDIDDVKYLRDKLFSALKVPASYLSRAEANEEDKTTLAQKDIRFARTVQRLQRSVISELEKIGIVHLFTLGYRGDDLVNWSLSLNNPSKLAEMQELEHWGTKFDVASRATEGFFSRRWIANKLFGITEEELMRVSREMYTDRKFEASLEASAEMETAAGAMEGGLGGDLAGLGGEDLGGEDLAGLGGEDLGGEDLGDAPPEDEGVLLATPDEAAPAARDDDMTTTAASKGKYYLPVRHRGGDRRNVGARKRNTKSKYSSETSKPTRRNLFKGYSELNSLTNGISEDLESTYRKEEEKLLQSEHDIKLLIDGLAGGESENEI